MMVGFILILILAALVSRGARNVLSGLVTLVGGAILLLASCVII
jgi:hypothetical protein